MKTVRKIIAVLVLAVLLAGCLPVYSYAAKNDPVKFTVSSTLFPFSSVSGRPALPATFSGTRRRTRSITGSSIRRR